jgi:hypothetical protein
MVSAAARMVRDRRIANARDRRIASARDRALAGLSAS